MGWRMGGGMRKAHLQGLPQMIGELDQFFTTRRTKLLPPVGML